MKRYFLLFFLLLDISVFCKSKLPVIIKSQEEIFRKIAQDISIRLPEEIEILVFRLMTVNSDKDTNERINKNFETIMKTQQFIYNYTLDFINDVINDPENKDYSADYSFIENYDEKELITYARYLNKDAILLASVVVFDDSNKTVWDRTQKKFVSKKVGLIQGNIFYTDSGESLLRFSYYFLID